MMFDRFFSLDNPKALKAQQYGWLNAINYMAPHKLARVGNLCVDASAGCIELCLGVTSGNAALYPTVLKSRIAKAQWFMTNRAAFMKHAAKKIRQAIAKAKRAGLQLCVRLNGSTDIDWAKLHLPGELSLIDQFPDVQFVDYTKSVKRALAHARGQLPPNYHLTFSRSETNWLDCLEVLKAGGNVAVIFADKPALTTTFNGWPIIDGDAHDLRHLDPQGGYIVALSPKGAKAKATRSGFVVR
jgi:hypothetical protein